MAQIQDIQNVFLSEIDPLLRNSDYYIAQKGYIKIPKYDEESRAEWKKLGDKYEYLLAKVDPTSEERWVRDYLKNKIEYLEVLQHFSEHIKDYQESMLESHNLSAQITGVRDVLDELEVKPDPSLVKKPCQENREIWFLFVESCASLDESQGLELQCQA